MTGLRIAEDVELPAEYITKTAAICAQRRKGKTYTASVIAEELCHRLLPWVALDPTGAWWGLRSSADGQHAGLEVVIIGGDHGDLPLDRSSGRAIADLVVDRPGWYVVDLSLLDTRAAEREFATDFAERLYRRKSAAEHRFPLHLFVDEADMFCPQEKEAGDNKMLGAFQAIVRRGGILGLGCTLITQRPALLNKSVLTQLDLLILLRLVAGNDQDAVDKNYIQRAGSREQRAELMGSLASLRLGEAWLWEPGAEPALFTRAHIRERETFNSSATPKLGERFVEPRLLADVNLDEIREQLAAAIDRAERDDPRVLHRRIGELERRLREQPAEQVEVEKVVHEKWVPPELLPALKRFLRGWDGVLTEIGGMGEGIAAMVEAIEEAAEATPGPPDGGTMGMPFGRPPVAQPVVRLPSNGETMRADYTITFDADPLPEGEAKVLTAIAQVAPATRQQLSILTGYKKSTRDAYIARLRNRGMVDIDDGGRVVATPEGVAKLGPSFMPLPTGAALRKHWLAELPDGEAKVLAILCDAYPQLVAGDAVSDLTGFKKSTRDAYLQRLRARLLIEKSGSGHRAVDTLFS